MADGRNDPEQFENYGAASFPSFVGTNDRNLPSLSALGYPTLTQITSASFDYADTTISTSADIAVRTDAPGSAAPEHVPFLQNFEYSAAPDAGTDLQTHTGMSSIQAVTGVLHSEPAIPLANTGPTPVQIHLGILPSIGASYASGASASLFNISTQSIYGPTSDHANAVQHLTNTVDTGENFSIGDNAGPPPIDIAQGATVEVDGASAQSINFLGTTGTLKLANSTSYTGQISGLAGSDALDLADVHYGASTTATFSGNPDGGILTVTDGTNTANLTLAGDYLGSGWTLSSDGNGGVLVVDPSLYPDASNTGVQAGVQLTTYTGHLTISTPGQVVSGLIITGGVQISASNVTLENCIIEVPSSSPWNVGVSSGLTGVTIKNCEIIGAGSSGPTGSYGIYVQGNSQVTINSVNMHDIGQGLVLNDGRVTLENSYIHDLRAGSGTHYEDIGYFGAAKSSTFFLNIQHNTLINQQIQTASVFLQNYFGPLNNVTVNDNILVGGDYTVYVDGSYSYPTSNISITNNHMGAGIYGITDFIKSSPTYTGNLNDGATLASASGFQSPVVLLASAPAGTYSVGDTISLTLYTSEAVTVSGTPTLTLDDGGSATYTGGSGTNALTFSYKVASGQSTSALTATAVNGLIYDLDGHALNTTNLPGQFSGVVIGSSSTAPTVTENLANDTGASATDHITSNATLTGTGDPNAVVHFTVDGKAIAATATANGSGAWSFTPTGLADGTHTIVASETNAAGNTGSTSLSFTLDTTAPAVTQTVASPTTGIELPGNTIVFTVNLSGAVTVTGTPTLTLNDGGTATYTGGSGTSALTFSYTVGPNDTTVSGLAITGANLPNGATVTDIAGNAANFSGALITFPGLQIDPPSGAPTITSFSTDSGVVGDHITNDSTLTLTGTAVANSTVNVYDGATLLGTAAANGGGAWSFTTATLANGNHSFTATDTASGVTSPASTAFSVTIDTVAPVAPTIASFSTDSGVAGDHITNDSTPTLTGTAEANATVKVYDGTTLLGTTSANGSGTWSYTTAALANGAHSLTATATDAAGNASAASAAMSITVDTSAPSTPTNLIATAVSPSQIDLSWTPSTDNAGVTGYEIFHNGVLVGTSTTNSYSDTGLSASTQYAYTVEAYDTAGNVSTQSASASATTPAVAWSNFSFPTQTTNFTASFDATPSQLGADIVIGLSPTTAASYSDLATVVRFNGSNTIDVRNGSAYGADATVSYNAGTSYHFEMVVNLSTDTYSVYVTPEGGSQIALATDYAFRTEQASATSLSDVGELGATGSATVLNFSIVPGAPIIASISPDSGVIGDGITNANILTVSGSATANSTVNVYDGSTLLGTATTNGSGAWSFTTATVADGSHSFTATDTLSGVTSAASAALSVTVDTVAPTAPTIASFSNDSGTAGDHITNDSTPTLTGTAEANATVKVYDGATLLGTTTANGSGAWSFTTAALANGAHSLTATATDAAGNASAASAAMSITVDTVAPTVSESLASDTGSSASDHITSNATLTGTGDPNAVVHFTVDGNPVAGTATANGSGAWSFTPTGLADGAHTVVASETDAAGNTGTTSFSFTLDTTAPTISAIAETPSSGVLGIGAAITLTVKLSEAVTIAGGTPTLTLNSGGTATYTGGSGSKALTFLYTVEAGQNTPDLKTTAVNLNAATITDSAGNAVNLSLDGVVQGSPAIDTTAPVAPTIASFSPDDGIVGDGITSATILTLTGAAEANSTVQIYDKNTLLGTTTANSGGEWSYTTGTLGNGNHNFAATATDAAANTSADSAALNVKIHTQKAIVSASNTTLNHSQTTVAASSLYTVSEPDNVPITQYDVWNSGTGGGHFELNGQALAVGQANHLTAAQMSQLSYVAGSGADTVYVRAFDGTMWSNWSSAFTVNRPNQAPVTTASNVILDHSHTLVAASSLFTANDPEGDTITQYDVWNKGTGGGHFELNGQALATGQANHLTAAQMSQLSYVAGSSADTMYVRAFDGTAVEQLVVGLHGEPSRPGAGDNGVQCHLGPQPGLGLSLELVHGE